MDDSPSRGLGQRPDGPAANAARPHRQRCRRGGWIAVAALLALSLVAGQAARAQDAVPTVRFEVTEYIVAGENPLGAEETQALLAPYLGAHEGIDGLLDAATSLESAIRARGFAFHRVLLPPQELEATAVRLEVVAFALSNLTIRGNEQFTAASIRRALPSLAQGEVPDHRRLARELELANQHPARQLKVSFRASKTADTGLNGDVRVTERRSWTYFANLANVGNSSTGPLRTTFGGRASNLWERDHVLSANIVTSPGHAGRTEQFAASYWIPLYQAPGALSFYAVKSDADTGRLLEVFDVSGSGRFLGAQYAHILEQRGPLTHQVRVAIDDKRFDNDIRVLTLAGNLGQDVRSRPITVGYSGAYRGDRWQTDFRLDYARNTQSGGGNNGAAYRANRDGARVQWDALRGGANVSFPIFDQWQGRAIFEGQYANEALIPGEQFGLGGMHSVRGFSEREVAGDDGVRASLELWAPPIEGTATRFVFFADSGRITRKEDITGLPRTDGIVSIGGGTRWQWKDSVAVSFDLGLVVEGTATRESGARGHLNVLVRY